MQNQSSSIIRQDILQVADSVAREKNINRDVIIEALEIALQKAARLKYGYEKDIRATIDKLTGEITIYHCFKVVEEVNDSLTEISLEEAQKKNADLTLGDLQYNPLPPIDFGRVAAQTARQVINQKVREAEREKQYSEYINRVGEIVNGIVRRIEYGNVIVDLGRTEAIIKRDELIPREIFQIGDRVRAYIMEVRQEQRGPQIFLSRTHPQFMVKLFSQEVPEIYDNIIEIKNVARDPGSRAKIAVRSKDSSIDPVGACVGMRGSRVQAVVNELQGEKIDIVPWSADMATFIINALAPAEVTKVVMDEVVQRIDVVVPSDHLSLAIGRRGQNVRLASELTGWGIDILTEEEESTRRNEEIKSKSALFREALNVDDMVAHLLVGVGFSSVEEVATVDFNELKGIEGFDDDIAKELKSRAQDYMTEAEKRLKEQAQELGVQKDLLEFEYLPLNHIVKLGQKKVLSLDDLADLATDELVAILGKEHLDEEAAGKIIMLAREHWFNENPIKNG